MDEQTVESDGKYVPKDKHEISSSSLQAPSDPDATFRHKAGEDYKGYVGNVTETVAEDGLRIITQMNLQPNICSDSQFLKDYIEDQEASAEPKTVAADGAYGGYENAEQVAAKGILLVTTALTGHLPDKIMADFELSEDGTTVLRCPMSYVPEKVSFAPKTGMFRIKFPRSCCEHCSNREKCAMCEQKIPLSPIFPQKLWNVLITRKNYSQNNTRN